MTADAERARTARWFEELRDRLTAALELIESLPEFPVEFRDQVMKEVRKRQSRSESAQRKLVQDIGSLQLKIDNITNAIVDGRHSPALQQRLEELEDDLSLKKSELAKLQSEDKVENLPFELQCKNPRCT